MTDTDEVTPLSDAEREQLAMLQYRQSVEQWQQNEEKRQADLAAIEPVIAILGDAAQLNEQIEDLKEAAIGLDREGQQSVERIVSILGYDGRALTARHARLSQAAQQPVVELSEEPDAGE